MTERERLINDEIARIDRRIKHIDRMIKLNDMLLMGLIGIPLIAVVFTVLLYVLLNLLS